MPENTTEERSDNSAAQGTGTAEVTQERSEPVDQNAVNLAEQEPAQTEEGKAVTGGVSKEESPEEAEDATEEVVPEDTTATEPAG